MILFLKKSISNRINTYICAIIITKKIENMEAHIYSFYQCVNGNLKFKGIYLMKYYNDEIENGLVVFKDTEIETAKANFVVDKNRVVKTGATWKNSNLAQKLIKKNCFVKSYFNSQIENMMKQAEENDADYLMFNYRD